jgi:hypothetical protein
MKDFQSKILTLFIQALVFFATNYFLKLIPYHLLLGVLVICLIAYLATPLLINPQIKIRRIILLIFSGITCIAVVINISNFNSYAVKNTRGGYSVIGTVLTANAEKDTKEYYPEVPPGKALAEKLVGEFPSIDMIYKDVNYYEKLLFFEFAICAFFLSLTISSILDTYKLKKIQEQYGSLL